MGSILDSMSLPSAVTTVTAIRIPRTQADALKRLAPSVSTSALVRVLLDLYFKGRIPEAYGKALAENKRTQKAILAGKKQVC
jgi:hypothetical protein